MAVLKLNNFVACLPEKTQEIFGRSIFRVKLDAASIGVLLRGGNNGKLLQGSNLPNTLQEIPEVLLLQFQLAAISHVLPVTPTANPEYLTWRGISERGLGYDLRDFPLEVTLPLVSDAGDDGVSRCSERDKDDPVIDSSHSRTEMGQTIDSDLG
jgi:hypothetical protein